MWPFRGYRTILARDRMYRSWWAISKGSSILWWSLSFLLGIWMMIMKEYCTNKETCRREMLMSHFSITSYSCVSPSCSCCDICEHLHVCSKCTQWSTYWHTQFLELLNDSHIHNLVLFYYTWQVYSAAGASIGIIQGGRWDCSWNSESDGVHALVSYKTPSMLLSTVLRFCRCQAYLNDLSGVQMLMVFHLCSAW